jgi:hypothetical protein
MMIYPVKWTPNTWAPQEWTWIGDPPLAAPPGYDSNRTQRLVEDFLRISRQCDQPSRTEATPSKGGDQPMKALWHVIVVDLDGRILLDTKVVADTETEAHFEAGVEAAIRDAHLRPRDVTVLTWRMGSVKVRKEPEQVRIVKDDGTTATA